MKPANILRMAEIYLSAIKKYAKDPSAGCLFICFDDNSVLLTKRNSAAKNSPNTWDIQGGRADEDDGTTEVTSFREAQEELGKLPKKKKLITKHVLQTPSSNEYVVYVYSVSKKEKENWTSKIDLDENEMQSYKWFPINKLPKNTHLELNWVKDIKQS
jgi:8-oxo-dGTP pyrophosphatase MutT (NUDIX family)